MIDIAVNWLNASIAFLGLLASVWSLGRPALQVASLIERLAVALISIGLGLSVLVPMTGDTYSDSSRLIMTIGATILFVNWAFYSATSRHRW